jgi:hypothetical protein
MTGELRNAIVSQYLSKNMINDSDKPLTNYFNAESNGSNISFADYKQGMVNQFLSSKLTDIGYVNKTSDGYVSYFTFLATLKYLSDNNNSVFINYLRSLVGGNASSDLSQNIPSYIA